MGYPTVTTTIGIGIIGAGYMGKLHSVAMQTVGAVFNTELRPVCEMLCATTEEGAAKSVVNKTLCADVATVYPT